MDEMLKDLFSRTQDNNWHIICDIIVGDKSREEVPQQYNDVFNDLCVLMISDAKHNKFVDNLKNYFSIACECYKLREDAIIKVFAVICSLIGLPVVYNNKLIVDYFPESVNVSIDVKLLAFNYVLEILRENYTHLSLSKTFAFNSFIDLLLANFKSLPEMGFQCFSLILEIDYQLINENHLKQLINEYFSDDHNINDNLISSKNRFLICLFDIYFKVRKSVKLHQIFLETTNSLENLKLDINQNFLQLYGKSILITPFGQLIELWQIFLDMFTVANIFLLKLFARFLSHIQCLDENIATHLRLKFNEMFDNTKRYLKKTRSLLSADNQLNELLLDLYYSWSSVLVLRMAYENNKAIIDGLGERLASTDWWDMSIICDFTKENVWKTLHENTDKLSLRSKKLILKLLFLKFRYFRVIIETDGCDLTEEKSNALLNELASGLVLKYGSNFNLWTRQQIEIVIIFLNDSDMCTFTDHMIKHIIDEENYDFETHKFLVNSNVWESIIFQTAFVGSLWKQISSLISSKKRKLDETNINSSLRLNQTINALSLHDSVWFKYTLKAPTFTKLNKMWKIVSNTSPYLETVAPKEVIAKTNHRLILKIMKIHSCFMPLEYLTPGNQLICLLCLSSFMFTIKFTNDDDYYLLDLILDSILFICDGVRSVWLFHFVKPSGYIINVLNVSKSPRNNLKVRKLIQKMIDIMFRMNTLAVNHIEELRNKLIEYDANDDSCFEDVLTCETLLLKRCLQIMNRKIVPKNMVKLKELCGSLSESLANTAHNRIKKFLLKSDNVQTLDSVLIVESFATVFEFQLLKSTDEENIYLKTKWKKLMAKLIDISIGQLTVKSTNQSCRDFLTLLFTHKHKLNNILPHNFITNLWNIILPETYKCDDELNSIDFLNELSGLEYNSRIQKFQEYSQRIHSNIEKTKQIFLESIDSINAFNSMIEPLVAEMITSCSSEEFNELINQLMCRFKNADFLTVAQLCAIWKAVFNYDFHQNQLKYSTIQNILNDLLTNLLKYCKQCNHELVCIADIQSYVKIPILDITRSIIHVSKNSLTCPQLYLSYNLCIETNLNMFTNDASVFAQLFDKVYLILNECLLQHRYSVVSSFSTYNVIVMDVLKCLMRVSDQQSFIILDASSQHRLELCSKNMDRLLTLMASFETDFAVYAPHLLADYVTQLQYVTVHPIIKKNLVSAMYRVLKVINNKDTVDMIYCRLSQSSREVFKILYDTYEKYYMFKGNI